MSAKKDTAGYSRKPYRDFPLFKHASGQWAKKINGTTHYFGTDPHAAVTRYQAERDDLYAGRTPAKAPDKLTVVELCNYYLTAKKRQMESGELAPRSWRDYHRACGNLIKLLGRRRLVGDLVADDFGRMRAKLALHRGPVGLANEIQRFRTVFKFGYDEGLLDKPVRFGSTFKKPSRKAMRQARQARGSRMFEADELRTIIDAAAQPLRAMVLLALNCGFGQTDVANLPTEAIDFESAFVNFPRPKTAIPRRAPLWPETLEALRQAIKDRPKPKDKAHRNLAFLTCFGRPWVRVNMHEAGRSVAVDSIGLEYNKLLVKLGLKRSGGFYNLRHVFRTIADGARDQPAIDHIMGHLHEGDMATFYRERIDDARLIAVVEHVRGWLGLKHEARPALKQ